MCGTWTFYEWGCWTHWCHRCATPIRFMSEDAERIGVTDVGARRKKQGRMRVWSRVSLWRNVSLWSEVSNWWCWCNSKWPNVRIRRTVCTDRHDDDDKDAIQNCRMSGSVELFTNIDITSKTRTDIMSQYVELCINIGMGMMSMRQLKTAECQNM